MKLHPENIYLLRRFRTRANASQPKARTRKNRGADVCAHSSKHTSAASSNAHGVDTYEPLGGAANVGLHESTSSQHVLAGKTRVQIYQQAAESVMRSPTSYCDDVRHHQSPLAAYSYHRYGKSVVRDLEQIKPEFRVLMLTPASWAD